MTYPFHRAGLNVTPECADTGLAKKMLVLAEAQQLPDDHELRVRAKEFEEASVLVFTGKCSVPRFMGIWARARRAYITHSGKSHIMED